MSDPFVSCTAAAIATQTINVGTGISLVIEHDPIALAKTVATVDRLSNGRFLFGVGAGWNREEMENHGTPYAKRWKVLEERVKAMKELWTTDESTFHGEYVNFDRVWSYPKPLQQPHPPVILGTFGSKWGRQRVADFGDGWIPIDLFHGDLAADIADLKERLVANGRDPDAVTISMFDVFETPEAICNGSRISVSSSVRFRAARRRTRTRSCGGSTSTRRSGGGSGRCEHAARPCFHGTARVGVSLPAHRTAGPPQPLSGGPRPTARARAGVRARTE